MSLLRGGRQLGQNRDGYKEQATGNLCLFLDMGIFILSSSWTGDRIPGFLTYCLLRTSTQQNDRAGRSTEVISILPSIFIVRSSLCKLFWERKTWLPRNKIWPESMFSWREMKIQNSPLSFFPLLLLKKKNYNF